ncbi:peptide ABC transporter substrate-binding protein [Hathewaya histolytica]|uniref:peptide ABC transporter substrate-binding protein n=1 Tax=Hathewaya histolytica TaxID=1498 RepID=UPI003B684117
MKKVINRAITFTICFFVMFLSGCIEKKEGIKVENRDYLVFNIEKLPGDLSMLKDKDIREKDLLFAVFEGLVKEDSNGNILPGLCDDWTINNELNYTFKIRKNATWSNGKKITAEDFEDLFKWIIKEGKNNTYVKELKCIYGVSEYIKGEKSFEDVAIKAKDKETLEIRLNYTCSYFLNILSNPLFTLRENNSFTNNYIGSYDRVNFTGPFKIKNIKQDRKTITLEKNKYYWENEKVISKRIDFIAIENEEEALINFEKPNPDLDILANPPKNEINRLVEKGHAELYSSFKNLNLIFNVSSSEKGKNIHLRKGIRYGLSRNVVEDIIDNKNAILTGSVIPSITTDGRGGNMGEREYFSFNTNVTVAKEFLEKSKFNIEENSITLVCEKNSINKVLAENIKKELKDNLKLKINIEQYKEQELQKVLEKGKFDMSLIEFNGTFDNPICFLEQWKMDTDSFYTGYKNSNFDYYVNKARNEKNHSQKLKYLESGEKLLLDDMPLIPIINFDTVICKNKNVKGYTLTKGGNIYLNYAYKEK